MRVAMVAACPFPSAQGSQVLIAGICRGLARRGHQVQLLTYGQGEGRVDPAAGFLVRRIRRLPGDDASRSGPTAMKPALDLLLAVELRRMLRGGGFDLVHAHNYEAAAVAVATRPFHGLPVLYHCHGAMREELPTYFASGVARHVARVGGSLFDRFVPRGADVTLALCAAAHSALLSAGVPADKVVAVPASIDDPGAPPSREGARRALAIEDDCFVVGYSGNLDGYQNLHALAAAVRKLASDEKRGRVLWLVATHRREERFSRMLEETGVSLQTRVVEARDFGEVRTALAASDVLVAPRATPTGFPIKLLNYMAAARALVVGPGSRGLVEDGREGLVAADDGSEALAACLGALQADPARRAALGACARQRFLECYTSEAVLPAIEQAYRRISRADKAPGKAAAVLS